MRCWACVPGTWGTGARCILTGPHERHESADGWVWTVFTLERKDAA